MAKYASVDLKNVAFVGAASSGKTTLIEALLHRAGAIARRGNVADGSSFVDYDSDEKEKKHTLFQKVFHFQHHKHEINVLDTPGYPDFLGESIAAMNAVETVFICVDAHAGVQFHTRKLWQEAVDAGRGRVILVNRIDHDDHVDLDAVLDQIREAFGSQCVPAFLPVGRGLKTTGVINVMAGSAEAPPELKDAAQAAHEQFVEAVVALDTKAMEHYFETGDVTLDELPPLLKQGVADGGVTPILFTAAAKNIGVDAMLDFLAEFCPSPIRGPYFKASAGADATAELIPLNPREHTGFAARVFKTVADPFVGRLSFVRVLTGEIKLDDHYLNPRIGKPEKMHHIFRPQGKTTEQVDFAQAGDIVVLSKIDSLETNDTLCAEKHPVRFPDMRMPHSMASLAVVPKSRNDEQKLSTGLKKLATEDPTFHVERDGQTGELVVRGRSQLHLETCLHRLQTHFKVDVDTHVPKIPLRETIVGKAEGHHRHKKQSGGRGQFGEVYLRIAPNERGKGFQFVDDTYGGSIPRQFLPAVEKGILDQMHKGVVAGYPVVDVVVSVYDGKSHDVDSDEASFKIAGARAFRDAFEKSKPVLLEPIVNLEVLIPTRFMGDVTSDLNGRRGRITGMDTIGETQSIKAHVPLKEVQTYAPDLRSISQGEGTFNYELSHYDVVPHKQADELMHAHKATRKDDEE